MLSHLHTLWAVEEDQDASDLGESGGQELYSKSQSFWIHFSYIQLTASLTRSSSNPPSRVWTTGGLMAIL